MKDTCIEIKYKDKVYHAYFNLNVMEQIQDEFGTLQAWGDMTTAGDEPNAKAIITGLMYMINEGIEIDNEENGTKTKPITHKQAGRILTELGLEQTAQQINGLVVDSVSDDAKNE